MCKGPLLQVILEATDDSPRSKPQMGGWLVTAKVERGFLTRPKNPCFLIPFPAIEFFLVTVLFRNAIFLPFSTKDAIVGLMFSEPIVFSFPKVTIIKYPKLMA